MSTLHKKQGLQISYSSWYENRIKVREREKIYYEVESHSSDQKWIKYRKDAANIASSLVNSSLGANVDL